jgi:death-on-curing protein
LRSEPRWLPLDEIIEINRDAVAQTDEPFFLRDAGLLDSACARPRNHWAYDGEDDIVTLAVALMFGIARNHPFEQGNKRTGLIAAEVFLEMNGYCIRAAEDSDALGEAVVAVIDGRMSDEDFVEMIRPAVVLI